MQVKLTWPVCQYMTAAGFFRFGWFVLMCVTVVVPACFWPSRVGISELEVIVVLDLTGKSPEWNRVKLIGFRIVFSRSSWC
jgi:hypothetical protein